MFVIIRRTHSTHHGVAGAGSRLTGDAVAIHGDATIQRRIDQLADAPDSILAAEAARHAGELLALGEEILERWLVAHDVTPTRETSEGFRPLALHRQVAKGDPSFNACRETRRELVYQHNAIRLEPDAPDVARRARITAMVAPHLALFVDGKLEVAGLGEFCCSRGHFASAMPLPLAQRVRNKTYGYRMRPQSSR